MHKWKPDYQFAHYTDITPEWCQQNNIKFILSDLDGTLAGWNEPVSDTFIDWYRSVEQVGVGVIIVSNNHQPRVDSFAEVCHLVGYARCHKPRTKKIRQELFEKGLHPDTALFLGDQLFTDVWCGKKLGVRTALITTPLGDYEPWKTGSKRWVERLVKKTWRD